MKLIPWRERAEMTPFRVDFEDWMDQLFDGGFANRLPESFRRGIAAPVNVAETDKDFLATIEIPGLDEKDIDVQILGDMLVITGERKWDQEKKGKEYHRVESQYGSFRRAIRLPESVRKDPESIAATYAKGMLEIRMPKVEPKPAAKIAVKTK